LERSSADTKGAVESFAISQCAKHIDKAALRER
jgi:hypothetical protein